MTGKIVLGCILTGQPIPNLLSVHHYARATKAEGRELQVLLFATNQMEEMKMEQHFKKALTLSHLEDVARSSVCCSLGEGDQLPDSFESAIESGFGTSAGDREMILNITGGTKMITIGAYKAAGALGAKVVYVPEGNPTTLRDLEGNVMIMRAEDIGVGAFVAAYGYEVTSALSECDKWQNLGVAALECLQENKFPILEGENAEEVRAKIRRGEAVPQGFKIRIKSGSMRNAILKAWPEPTTWKFDGEFIVGTQVDKLLGCYLTGGWLEAVLFSALRRRAGEIGVHDVNTSVRLGTKNEFDIVFMRGTTLCTVECKSGSQEHPGASPLADLYKAEAITHPLKALHTKVWYATTAKKIEDESGNVSKELSERANMNKWGLIAPRDLRDLAACTPGSDSELSWLKKHFGSP